MFSGIENHQCIDLLLARAMSSAALANVDDLGCRRNQIQHLLGDQIVMQHHLSVSKQIGSPQREQVCCPWACADDVNLAAHWPALLFSAKGCGPLSASRCSNCFLVSLRGRTFSNPARMCPSHATQDSYSGPNSCSS